MTTGNWLNKDGLFLQFGTSKATAEVGGDYLSYGQNRVAEVLIDLSTVTSSTAAATTGGIVSNTLFFPAGQGIFIERVELVSQIGVSVSTTAALSIGLIQGDRSTVPSTGGATAFVAAITSTSLSTAGEIISFTSGTASGGGLIGNYNTQWNTNTSGLNSAGGYITANLGSATAAVGLVLCRIFYHGVGTISN